MRALIRITIEKLPSQFKAQNLSRDCVFNLFSPKNSKRSYYLPNRSSRHLESSPGPSTPPHDGGKKRASTSGLTTAAPDGEYKKRCSQRYFDKADRRPAPQGRGRHDPSTLACNVNAIRSFQDRTRQSTSPPTLNTDEFAGFMNNTAEAAQAPVLQAQY